MKRVSRKVIEEIRVANQGIYKVEREFVDKVMNFSQIMLKWMTIDKSVEARESCKFKLQRKNSDSMM